MAVVCLLYVICVTCVRLYAVFIHASWITGPCIIKVFFCLSGPKEKTRPSL